jgi:hypothetical protein
MSSYETPHYRSVGTYLGDLLILVWSNGTKHNFKLVT